MFLLIPPNIYHSYGQIILNQKLYFKTHIKYIWCYLNMLLQTNEGGRKILQQIRYLFCTQPTWIQFWHPIWQEWFLNAESGITFKHFWCAPHNKISKIKITKNKCKKLIFLELITKTIQSLKVDLPKLQ